MTNNNPGVVGARDGTHPPGFVTSADGYVRMAYRMFDKKAGQTHAGHQHDVDHGTIVVKGKVRVRWSGATSGERVFDATDGPCHFMVAKHLDHEIAAIEDSIWLCCFLPHDAYESDMKDFWNEKALGAEKLYG